MTKEEINRRLENYPGAHENEKWKLETDLSKCTDREKSEMKKLGISQDCGLNRGEIAHVLWGWKHTK